MRPRFFLTTLYNIIYNSLLIYTNICFSLNILPILASSVIWSYINCIKVAWGVLQSEVSRFPNKNIKNATLKYHGMFKENLCNLGTTCRAIFIEQRLCKLYGVGPINNRPSTNYLQHFAFKKKCVICHLTHATWHYTCDM